MKVLVPSVPHTGTHFMRELFKGHQPIHLEHILPSTVDSWREHLRQDLPVVVPMRHPFVVAESWKRRNKDPLALPELWHLLVDEVEPWEPQYLCLDAPEIRNSQLKAINDHLHLSLSTSWPRVVELGISPLHTDYQVHLNDQELAATAGVVDELHEFFERWYRARVWSREPPRTRGW